ncbi:hypothetical protein AB1283_12395 [Bacillus sp. S13(2024)]|uniref:tetratricopeptide repeat protein n=1 Tax=unclassified Bacillus (in: firmicutes) TaxID=185979 RepID=UPI003D1A0199
MRLKEKTYDELLELEAELHEIEDEYVYHTLVLVYKEMYRRLRLEKRNKDDWEINDIKTRLIKILIQYGTYLKTVYRKDDNLAVNSLAEALRYELNIPIAHYRLGFLHYKRQDYFMAFHSFESAISTQKSCTNKAYLMNDQQLYNAHMYLTNSSLHISAKTYEQMEQLPVSVNRTGVDGAEISPLYDLLKRNEQYLNQHAFYKITREGQDTCSKDECEHIIDEEFRTLILYFSDRSIRLVYRGDEVVLSKNQGDALKVILLQSTHGTPVTRMAFRDIIDSRDEAGEVKKNSFIQTVRRIRDKLVQLNGFDDLIISTQYRGEAAYYFNEEIPFCVMYRVDE